MTVCKTFYICSYLYSPVSPSCTRRTVKDDVPGLLDPPPLSIKGYNHGNCLHISYYEYQFKTHGLKCIVWMVSVSVFCFLPLFYSTTGTKPIEQSKHGHTSGLSITSKLYIIVISSGFFLIYICYIFMKASFFCGC